MANPDAQTLAEQVVSGVLRVAVTVTWPLEQAAEAFAAFGAGTPGKTAVSWTRPTNAFSSS